MEQQTLERPRLTMEGLDRYVQESAKKGAALAIAELAPKAPMVQVDPILDRLGRLFGDGASKPKDGDVIIVSEDHIEVLTKEQVAEQVTMGQAALGGTVARLDALGGLRLPVGSVLFGAIPGAIVGTAIDRVVSSKTSSGGMNIANVGLKVGVGIMAMRFLPRYLGKMAATFFVGGLLVQVIADALPIQGIVNRLAGFLSSILGGRVAAGQTTMALAAPTGLLAQVGPRTNINDSVFN